MFCDYLCFALQFRELIQTLYAKVPRWLIFCIDLLFVLISLGGSYLLRFNFLIPQKEYPLIPLALVVVLSVRALSFLRSKIFKGVVRFTSSADIMRILKTLLIGSVILFLINSLFFYAQKKYAIPHSIIIIEFLLSCFILVFSRLLVKTLYFEMRFSGKPKWDVIIYGAGELGVIAKRTLDRDRGAKYNIIGFVDRDKKRAGKVIEGIKVYDHQNIKKLIDQNHVSHLIIASQRLSINQKRALIDLCLEEKIVVRDVPPLEKWIDGKLSFNQIKHVRIEDLLGRDQIDIEFNQIKKDIEGKVILLSGAAGSIGSEICRQILQFNPKKLILLDQAESALYELELELKNQYADKNWQIIIADIKDKAYLKTIFETQAIEVVFHAAAYKHVPLMQENSTQAIKVNVLGTQNIANLANEFNADKFIMVSTDKAVNPTSMMGASKRMAEMYVQALNAESKTAFITTRFGNVLGSNGSVIPLFRKQIENGGPLTVTHPDITRYFMTIPEACKLVLQAFLIGKGGEIFVFNMGESVKIIDLAKKMIQLSGLEEGKDIQIKYTGLRPGEKLYEELFLDQEQLKKTAHPDIFISNVVDHDFKEISDQISKAFINLNKMSERAIFSATKQIVKEFVKSDE